MITVGWSASGRIGFQFFPTAEADRIFANVGFVSGTPAAVVQDYLKVMEKALRETEEELDTEFISLVISRHGSLDGAGGSGDHFGSVRAELVDPDKREVRNRDIIKAWKDRLPPIPGREFMSVVEPRAGPPGSDLDIRIVGASIQQVKVVAEEITGVLRQTPGVSGIGDDAPYGREQMVLKLTPVAEALGLSIDTISTQLRAAYDGVKIQELSDGFDDVEVRLLLPRTRLCCQSV